MFITTGSLTIQEYDNYHGQTTQMVLGFFCIVTGIVFLIDFLFAVKNTRFTVTTTTVTRNEFTTWNIFLSTYLPNLIINY